MVVGAITENNIITNVVDDIPTYTFFGESCTFNCPNNASFNILITNDNTNLTLNNKSEQDDNYSQTGSITFDNSSGAQSLIFESGYYSILSLSANNTGSRSIILKHEVSLSIPTIDGNANYFIGTDSIMIIDTSITGTGTFFVGSNSAESAEENAKLIISSGLDNYTISIIGDNCEVSAHNASIIVRNNVCNAIIKGNNNTILVNSGALSTLIIGDSNVVADSGKNTQQITNSDTNYNTGKFGNITITGDTISNTNDIIIDTNTVLIENLTASGTINADTITTSADATIGGNISTSAITGTTLTLTSSNNATSITTGSLILAGGMGVSKDFYIGGNIILATNATVDGYDISTMGTTLNNLSTTLGLSNLTANEITQIANINNNTISTTQWGYLSGLNQSLASSSAVSFLQMNAGNIAISSNTITAVTGNITINSTLILNGDPTNPLGAATKQYVDNMMQGIDNKNSCIVMASTLSSYVVAGSGSTKTLTASANGTLTIDGVSVIVGNRILVNLNGVSGSVDNGIYDVTNVGGVSAKWILTRSSDANSSAKVTSGMYTFIESGTTYSGRGYVLITTNVVLDTTTLVFTQFSGAGTGNTYTMSNLAGSGVGVYSSISSNNFNMRNIAGSTPIAVALSGNDITVSLTQSGITHANLGSLTSSDDHTQYVLLAGRSGGQVLIGGSAASNNLTLRSTSNLTKGYIAIDENTISSSTSTGALVVSGGVGIGNNLFVSGTGSFGSTLAVSGQTTMSGGAKLSSIVAINSADNSSFTGGATLSIYGSSTATTPTITLQAKSGDATVGSINITTSTASTATNNGAVVITGGLGVGGAIYATSANITTLTAPTLTSSTSITTPIINGNSNALLIRANTSGTGTITIPSTTNFTGSTASSSTNTGCAVFSGGIGIAGATYIGGLINVNGAATLSSTLVVNTSVSSPNFITAGTTMTITGGSGSSGMLIYGSTAASGQLTLLSTSSATKANAGILMADSIASTSTSTGTLVITGGLGVSGAIYAGSFSSSSATFTSLTVSSTLNATNITSGSTLSLVGTSITTNNPTTISNTLTVSNTITGNTNIISPIFAGSTSSLGNLTIRANTIDTTGTITFPSICSFTNNTASSSTSTGGVVINGGIGISGAMYIGGLINCSSTLTVSGTSTLNSITTTGISTTGSSFNITGGSAGTGLNIYGSTAASGQLSIYSTNSGTKGTSGILMPESIASTSISTGTLVISGGLGVSGAIYSTSINTTSCTIGSITFSSGTITASSGLTISAGGTIQTANSINLTSSSSTSLTLSGGMTVAGNASITGTVSGGTLIGATHAGSTVSGGNLTIRANTADATGTITFPSVVSFSNSTASSSTSTGAITVSGGVGIAGSINIGGNGTFGGNVTISGALSVIGSLTYSSATVTSLNITNLTGNSGTTTNIIGSNIVSGMTLTGSSSADGQLTILSTSSTNKATAGILMTESIASTSTSTGTLVITGGMGVGGTIYTSGFNATSATIGSLTVSGSISIASGTATSLNITTSTITNLTTTNELNGSDITMTGTASANIMSATTSITTPLITRTGTLTLTGSTGITTGSQFSITNSTSSSSTSTGALIVSGGVGIGGSLYVGNLNMSGTTITSSSTLTITASTTTHSGTIGATSCSLTNTTPSSSTTTGALVVSGGIGVADSSTFAKNISIGSSSPSYNSAVGSIYMANITTEPSASPNNATLLQIHEGRLASNGTLFRTLDANMITARVKTNTALPSNVVSGNTITASVNGALPTIDGITIALNDILFVDSASGVSATYYGIYTITNIGNSITKWVLTRSTFANTPAKFPRGTIIIVSDGANYGRTTWMHTTNFNTGTSFTFSTNLTFSQISGNFVTGASNLGTGIGVYSALSANTLQFNNISAGTGITANLISNDITISTNDSAIIHNNLSGLSTGDPHTQYVLSAGRAGGQTLYGGTSSGNNLILQSNSNSANTGAIIIPSTLQISSGIINGTSGSNLIITGSTTSGSDLILRSTSHATKGNVIIDESTTSTSSGTGCLITTGGIGCANNISIGNNLYIGSGTAEYNSAANVIHLDNISTNPTANPATGVHLFARKNNLMWNDNIVGGSKIIVNYKTTSALPANTANGTTIVATNNGVLGNIDGLSPAVGDIVFVDYLSDISPTTAYGVYEITSVGSAGTKWSMTRSTLANTSNLFKRGTIIYVSDGASAGLSQYIHASQLGTGIDFILNTHTPVFINNQGYYNNVPTASTSINAATIFTSVHNTFNTPILPIGQYIIMFSFEANHTSSTASYYYKVSIDGISITGSASQGLSIYRDNTTVYSSQVAGFGIQTFSTEASHTIDLRFNAGGVGTATITNSTLLIRPI